MENKWEKSGWQSFLAGNLLNDWSTHRGRPISNEKCSQAVLQKRHSLVQAFNSHVNTEWLMSTDMQKD